MITSFRALITLSTLLAPLEILCSFHALFSCFVSFPLCAFHVVMGWLTTVSADPLLALAGTKNNPFICREAHSDTAIRVRAFDG